MKWPRYFWVIKAQKYNCDIIVLLDVIIYTEKTIV